MNAVRRYTTLVVLFVLLPGQVGEAQNTTKPRPRLVLVIVADQFRYDYLSRFGPLFGKNGLRRLMREGATWTNANFDYVPTKTAPGHTAIMTGAPPAVTGIIANEWIGPRLRPALLRHFQRYSASSRRTSLRPAS
jgi:predicted AlkP superfamily pyrophosphatase or phosphodiesterase